jgi:hypothetical protein
MGLVTVFVCLVLIINPDFYSCCIGDVAVATS